MGSQTGNSEDVDVKVAISGHEKDSELKIDETLAGFSEEEINKAWRKVDWHVMPIAVLLYLASYIDRANIGNARVLGMTEDLKLTSGQYNWALSVFFIGYVVNETPSNVLLKRLRPSYYIPSLTITWGIICALFTVVQTPAGLFAIRFFLGLAEAGFLPGIIFWVGSWYPRHLQGRRYSVLYSTVSLTGAFGGLLATAIHTLDGNHGIAGWRWIFIVEGVVTIGLGLLSFIFMSDYPVTANWLTEREKRMINLTNEADRALLAEEGFNKKQIISAFTDWRTYLWGVLYLSTYIPVYSVILSLPSVVGGLGYRGTTATLMACPPYGFGFIIVLLAGYTTDRFGRRYWHVIFGCCMTVIALIVLMSVEDLSVRYGMFFIVMFMFVPIAVEWSWLAGNIAGSNKRAAATGLIFSIGNIGGAVSGQIYRAEWGPLFVNGHAVNLGCYVVALISATVLWWSFKRDNRLRDGVAGEQEFGEPAKEKGMLGQQLGDLGDRHPRYRYLL